MQLSIFSDEINRTDPTRALDLAHQWGINYIEVRSLPQGRFPAPDVTALAAFGQQVQDAGLQVSAVSPGFCKCPVDDPSIASILATELPRACDWAQRWGTDLVSLFAFRRGSEKDVPEQVIDRLGQMAEIISRYGCRPVLENEAGCWGGTGTQAAQIIRQVGADKLQLCWDPGNAARAGAARPFPDEYAQLKDLVAHVHLKNFDPATNSWSLIEKGTVDWPGQLAALKADGYSGYIVVETHLGERDADLTDYHPELTSLEANTRRNLDYLQSLLKA